MTVSAHARLGLAVAAALALSLSAKAAGIGQLAAHDEDRLVRDLARTMQAAGYVATIGADTGSGTGSGKWWDAGLVTARKGGCTVELRNAARYGVDREAVARTRMTAGPMQYYVAGAVRQDYPRFRSEFTWRMQRELGRVGIRLGITPALAVAATSACAPDPRLLAPVRLYLRQS